MAESSINAGRLDKRVTLLAPVYNEFEDEIVDWSAVTDVWAALMPESARETNEAGRIVAQVFIPVIIRYRRDIDPRWRLRHAGATYEIEGIDNPLHRNETLRLTCREVR